MACVVTLKRPHDFDPYMSPENAVKRIKQSPPVHTSLSKSPELLPSEQHRPCGKLSSATALEDYLRHEFHLVPRTDDCPMDGAADSRATSVQNTEDVPSPGQPFFSLKQIRHVFARLLREHGLEMEARFEKLLQERLNDQYMAFLNFTQDQIHRQFQATEIPSYIS
uniref:Akirin n=1 Tax=Trichuris muris TaxID=70415 RepID=A0A5S6QWA2_TRIMR